MSEPTQPVAETTGPAPKAFLARIIGVFFSPGETFEDIRRKPTILMPMVLMVVMFAMISYFLLPAQFADQIERTATSSRFQNLSSEQQEQQMAMFEDPPGWLIAISVAGGPIAIVVFMCVFALLYWGAGHLLGGEPTYKGTLSMVLFISFVNPIAHMLVKLPLIMSKGTVLGVTFGPAMFMPELETTSRLYLSLAALDLFNIWSTVLTGIGLAKIGRISTAMGMIIAIVFFAIATGIQLFFAGLGS